MWKASTQEVRRVQEGGSDLRKERGIIRRSLTDGSGALGLAELDKVAADVNPKADYDNAKGILSYLDRDGDSLVNMEEFVEVRAEVQA